MRILATGASGQVGAELSQISWPEGVELVMASRAELDLTDVDAIGEFVSTGGFDVVINPAAYTAVDKAEADMVAAWRVNALAPAALAEATRKARIPLLHVSTDYVFDGLKVGAYVESDWISPIGVYGASKAAGELAVRTGNPRHVIMRTSWVFSANGNNFVKTMLRLAGEKQRLRIVDDQHGCPTSAKDIATALATIAVRLASDPSSPSGTYHFANKGAVTWYGFAQEIFRQLASTGNKVPVVDAISTIDYPTPAKRPANSVLNTEKIVRDFSICPRPWDVALAETLVELKNRQ
ncbi:dTDP-4-dehydrorhamnose reductase [Ensifer sp. Root127]|uniref:dTDP-4-dehydrorhamnose reductase n=1 Tax=Ensifer sp. Root127 TaxID=1736440 RepID=UPI00070AA4EF|nr:dTDP-4-dehydrorhamnose reductase [Ensifer sp. Root127]KQW72500.1 NAD(P)-dependent oxidoreductase [Ensifer sp. Root127]